MFTAGIKSYIMIYDERKLVPQSADELKRPKGSKLLDLK